MGNLDWFQQDDCGPLTLIPVRASCCANGTTVDMKLTPSASLNANNVTSGVLIRHKISIAIRESPQFLTKAVRTDSSGGSAPL